jgi:AraC family transcriptional regulator
MGTVTIVAEKENHELYNSISFEEEKIDICTLGDPADFVRESRSDLIILDCGSHVEKGLQFLKEIKALKPNIPVIYITDRGSEGTVLKAFKTGARDFFKKPVNIPELQKTVKGILSVKKATQEKRHQFKTEESQHNEVISGITTDEPLSVIRVIRYIEDNLLKTINLEMLANQANISKYHFCRLFKRYMGTTPMQFVLARRIIKAKELLRREGLTISMVAAEAGFSELSSFTEQFKKFTGKTPTQYKKSLKK